MLAEINILLTIQELYLLGDLILICLSNGILTKSSTVCQYTGQVVVLKNLFIVQFVKIEENVKIFFFLS